MDIKKHEPLWGSWYLREIIGTGRFGVVYKAEQTVVDKKYVSAVKHISIPKSMEELISVKEHLFTDDDDVLRGHFLGEVKSMLEEYDIQKQFAGNKYFVQSYDIFYLPKEDMPGFDLLIRMELLNSINTRFRKLKNPKDTETEAVKLGMDICNALQEMHAKHYIHRDIKPQNILVSDEGIYKLADFGTVRKLGGAASFMSLKGTMDYLAPEIIRGDKVGVWSDIYSLGLVLHYVLNRYQLPMSSDEESSGNDPNVRRFAGERIPAPIDASPEMTEIILKACSFEPEERYASAAEMYKALEKLTPEGKRKIVQEKIHQCMSDLERAETIDEIRRIRQNLSQMTDHEDAAKAIRACDEKIERLSPEAYQEAQKRMQDGENVRAAERKLGEYPDSQKMAEEGDRPERQRQTKKTTKSRKGILLGFVAAVMVCAVGLALMWNNNLRLQRREEKIAAFKTKEKIVTFGTYPQTASGTDATPIEWIVLDVEGNQALLLSRYGLDAQPYNKDYEKITWENCTLREWLNGTFLNRAFTKKEQTGIMLTDVDNSDGQCYSEWNTKWNTSGGKNTPDMIFLLSYAEAKKYLGVEYDYNDDAYRKSLVVPTAYAAHQGAYISGNKTEEGKEAGWWWLRSPGFSQVRAAVDNINGTLYSFHVHDTSGCVRPALWINLESDIF